MSLRSGRDRVVPEHLTPQASDSLRWQGEPEGRGGSRTPRSAPPLLSRVNGFSLGGWTPRDPGGPRSGGGGRTAGFCSPAQKCDGSGEESGDTLSARRTNLKTFAQIIASVTLMAYIRRQCPSVAPRLLLGCCPSAVFRLSAVVRSTTIRPTSEASRRNYAGEKLPGGPSNIRDGYRDNTGGFSTLWLPQRGCPNARAAGRQAVLGVSGGGEGEGVVQRASPARRAVGCPTRCCLVGCIAG